MDFERTARGASNIAYVAGCGHQLMAGMGYERYGAQGGDFGARDHVLGDDRPRADRVSPQQLEIAPYKGPGSRRWSRRRRNIASATEEFWRTASATRHQSTKPQTLGYGLNDSTAGLAAGFSKSALLGPTRARSGRALLARFPDDHGGR